MKLFRVFALHYNLTLGWLHLIAYVISFGAVAV